MKNLYNKNSFCVIISHTPYCKSYNGDLVGLGSTVEEIDRLSTIFNKIYHFAPIHGGEPPLSYMKHENAEIEIIPMISVGGKNFGDKFKHILFFFKHLKKIKPYLNKTDLIHFRVPTGFGLLFLPWLYLFWKKNIWVKYAGSWNSNSVPLTYKIQRWMLLRFPSNFKITINSPSEKLGNNFFTFCNPCFDKKIIAKNYDIVQKKNFKKELNLVFVGRVEEKKGISSLLEIMEDIVHLNIIKKLQIVGDSNRLDYYINKAKKISDKICLTGPLSRKDVFNIYSHSHIIILLSHSEGLPKVLMEAAVFGCVPIVSNFSGISKIIKDNHNGFILESYNGQYDYNEFKTIIHNPLALKKCSLNAYKTSHDFTYEKYLKNVKDAILF